MQLILTLDLETFTLFHLLRYGEQKSYISPMDLIENVKGYKGLLNYFVVNVLLFKKTFQSANNIITQLSLVCTEKDSK